MSYTQTDATLDAIIHSLQNMPTFDIYAIVSDGTPVPWMEVSGPEIAAELVIRESRLAVDVQTVSVKIMEWGRLAARCQRIVDIENRRYRTWKAKLVEERIAAGEKLTEKAMEAIYRASPQYDEWSVRIERATEALSSCQAILDGFRAKREMLRAAIRPAQEGGFSPSFAIP